MSKLVYGVSKWTNSSRAGARHLDNGKGLPLCGGQGRKVLAWERSEGRPTCAECIRIEDAPYIAADRAADQTMEQTFEF